MRIGVIGCGMVSHAYCGTIARAPDLELAALASRTMASAEARAAQYGGVATSVAALLADDAIDLVVVLAPPSLHHSLGRQVLAAGKHLYLEKPLATALTDAADLLTLAATSGLQIGCAPDTFLGEGHQRARALLDGGAIGRATGGSVAFGTAGMEGWHPDPAFFFAAGGGPLLDIGGYYVTQLVDLLGPVAEVSALGATPRTERTARDGSAIPVSVPTSVAGALRFESGALVSLAMSWDVRAHRRPPIEIHGETGTLVLPDPNGFGGATLRGDGGAWETHGEQTERRSPTADQVAQGVAALMRGIDPITGGAVEPATSLRLGDRRGLGVVEMVRAIRAGRIPRAGGALAYHVLETLIALERSCAGEGIVPVASRVARPAAVEEDL